MTRVTCTHADVLRRSSFARVHIIKWVWLQNSRKTGATCYPLCKSLDPPLIAISYLSLCSCVKVAEGYLCFYCQARAVNHVINVTWLLTQHKKKTSLRGVGSGHETTKTNASKLINCRPGVNCLTALGEGVKILCIKDQYK